MNPTRAIATFVCGCSMAASGNVAASEPLLEQLQTAFQQESLRIGVVVQVVGSFRADRPESSSEHNGFSLATTRLRVSGKLDRGLSYVLQGDFNLDPVILDARLSFATCEQAALDVGLFKAPFSAEFLIAAQSIDFINRSLVVSTLAPGRQLGIAYRRKVAGGLLGYNVGAFNGNGRTLSGNDNEDFMGVARATLHPRLDSAAMEFGASIAFNRDEELQLLGESHNGERFLWGVDARVSIRRWLFSAEFIQARLDQSSGKWEPSGFQTTAGFMLVPQRHQLLLRYDLLAPDSGSDDSEQLIFGYNYWPTQAFELQLNAVLPLADGAKADDSELLANFQVAF